MGRIIGRSCLIITMYMATAVCLVSAQEYDAGFYEGGSYLEGVPSPDEYLGYSLGTRPARYNEMVGYLRRLAETSPRAELIVYGETNEGRKLHYLVITSDENTGRLEEIRSDIGKLADPRKANAREAERIIKASPGVIWLGYAIHGDELSSTDAAIFVAYQLAAGTDEATTKLLDELVICIDPLQNPDGRERFLAQMQQWGGGRLNPDVQSLQHSGIWPWGRGNHYLFDMNRDWFTLVHPETRGKVKAILHWKPQVIVDSHEMGSYDTYLFGSPRHPFNPHVDKTFLKWSEIFSDNQAEAYDTHGWSYYTREWNEEWFPGYGSSWATYAALLGILYEQAGVDGSLIKRPDGSIMTYRESVHHHIVSSLANIKTSAERREEISRDYYNGRSKATYGKGRDKKAYLIKPGANVSRTSRFLETLEHQEIEVYEAEKSFTATARRYDEARESRKRFPAGTYIVRLNQPMGPLAESILDFDPHMTTEFLKEERRELEKFKRSRLYDATAWSLLLAYGLDAYWTESLPKLQSKRAEVPAPDGEIVNGNAKYGYIFDSRDDRAVSALATFLEKGYSVRINHKPFTMGGKEYSRGSIILRNHENPETLREDAKAIAKANGITITGVNTAQAEKGVDLGGRWISLLEAPRIAIAAGAPLSGYSVGVAWHTLEEEVSARYSMVDISRLGRVSLKTYNVLILPDARGGSSSYKRILGKSGLKKLKDWVRSGGTLIAIGGAAVFAADTSTELSSVRLKRQALDKLDGYAEAAERSRAAESPQVDSLDVWAAPGTAKKSTLEKKKNEDGKKSEIEKKDERDRIFRPRGVIMDTEIEYEHWLTYGIDAKSLPVFVSTTYAFLSDEPVSTPVRLAQVERLRLGGLLWQEARQRWAETAYATRESFGDGQIILFSNEPNYRAFYLGANRLMMNAIFFGPGLGTRHPAPW